MFCGCLRISNGVTWIIFWNLFIGERVGLFSEHRHSNYTLRTTKLLGGILVPLCLSVRPSVCPSIPHPLCSTYSSGWIHFIFIHLIKQLQKVCRVWSLLQNLKIWIFGNLKKTFNLDFVLFWLGIWWESLVWVILGWWWWWWWWGGDGISLYLFMFCHCCAIYMHAIT